MFPNKRITSPLFLHSAHPLPPFTVVLLWTFCGHTADSAPASACPDLSQMNSVIEKCYTDQGLKLDLGNLTDPGSIVDSSFSGLATSLDNTGAPTPEELCKLVILQLSFVYFLNAFIILCRQ